MFKKYYIFILLALTALSLSACAGTQPAASAPEQIRSISVNGTGTVALSPDIAVVSVGVQTQASDAQTAVDQNNELVASINAAMAELGISDADLKTTNFSVYINSYYGDMSEMSELTYVVNNNVEVTVRDLQIIGEVLAKAISVGANNIYGIQFDVSDREAAYAQAMELAIANARTRAEVLAGAGELEIAGVHSISTIIGDSWLYSGSRNMDLVAAGGAGDIPVSPGKLEIVVDVTVVYEVE